MSTAKNPSPELAQERLHEHAPEHVHGPDCNHHHEPIETYRREAPKLGRNDPCHCGSGKKYKKCHGAFAA